MVEPSTVVSGEVNLVTFNYEDILVESKDLSEKIKEAFGPEGYGICIVSNIPGFLELRQNLLPLGPKLANLPKKH